MKGIKDSAANAAKKLAPVKSRAAKPRTIRASAAQTAKATKRRPRAAPVASRANAQAYGNRTFTRTSSPHQGISITVQIPPLRRPRTSKKPGAGDLPELSRGRLIIRALALPMLLIVGSLVFFGTQVGPQKKAPSAPVATVRTGPDYKPLLPSAEKASTTKYDAKRNLVTYNTTFSGARITVSQQPLPANFAKDPAALQKAADSIKASRQIDTAKGPLLVATNEDTNEQLALYATSKVLVFIHCAGKLDEASWKSFIELLEAKSWEELI